MERRTPCRFFLSGHCRKGDSCTFLHEGAEDVEVRPRYNRPRHDSHARYPSAFPRPSYNEYEPQPRYNNYQPRPDGAFPRPSYNEYEQRPRYNNYQTRPDGVYPTSSTPRVTLCTRYSTEQYCTNPNCAYTHQYSIYNLIKRARFLSVPSKCLSGLCIYNQSKLFISSADALGNIFQYSPDMNPNNMQKMQINNVIGAILSFKQFLICAVSASTPRQLYGLIIYNEKGEVQQIECHKNEISDIQIYSEEKNIFLTISIDRTISVWLYVDNIWKVCQQIDTGLELTAAGCFEDMFAVGSNNGILLFYQFSDCGFIPKAKLPLGLSQKEIPIVLGICYEKTAQMLICICGEAIVVINIKNPLFTPFQITWKHFDRIQLTCLALCVRKKGSDNETIILTGDMKGKVKVRELKDGIKEIDSFIAHKSPVRKFMVLKNQVPNSFFTLGLEDTVSLWEFQEASGTDQSPAIFEKSEDRDCEMQNEQM